MPLAARPCRWNAWLIACAVLFAGIAFLALIGLVSFFPIDYHDQITRWSTTRGLEPALVASVIRNESRFVPTATSPAGALGLMQIMPPTGQWIADQLLLLDYEDVQLLEASRSLELGTWYLRYLLDRFGDLDQALMAYNAGPTNAERWNGNLKLAFDETRRYLRRIKLVLPIYRAYFAIPRLADLVSALGFRH